MHRKIDMFERRALRPDVNLSAVRCPTPHDHSEQAIESADHPVTRLIGQAQRTAIDRTYAARVTRVPTDN